MISPQSIAVAAAAGNLVGKESELFRFTVKHSFIMLILSVYCIGTSLCFKWLIPFYTFHAQCGGSNTNLAKGYTYVIALA
jgi:lactate permease